MRNLCVASHCVASHCVVPRGWGAGGWGGGEREEVRRQRLWPGRQMACKGWRALLVSAWPNSSFSPKPFWATTLVSSFRWAVCSHKHNTAVVSGI